MNIFLCLFLHYKDHLDRGVRIFKRLQYYTLPNCFQITFEDQYKLLPKVQMNPSLYDLFSDIKVFILLFDSIDEKLVHYAKFLLLFDYN